MGAGLVERVGGVLQRRCRECGTVVESTLGLALSTRFTETVVCPGCGVDNSVRPSFIQRLRYGRRMAAKKRLVLGFWWWLRYAPWRCWLMDYETPIAPSVVRVVAYGLLVALLVFHVRYLGPPVRL